MEDTLVRSNLKFPRITGRPFTHEGCLKWGEKFNYHPPSYIFRRVLETMPHLRILDVGRERVRMRDLNEVSLFLIGFDKTRKRGWKSLWFPRSQQLENMDGVEGRLSKVPLVGLPSERGKDFLEYDILVGYLGLVTISYDGEPHSSVVYDRVRIVEKQ